MTIRDDFKTTNKPNELRICCPYCDDIKYHCYVNTKMHTFHCFRCEKAGSSYELEKALRIGGEVIPGLDALRSRILKLTEKRVQMEFDLNKISIPLDTTNSPIAYEYITSRGFTDAEIERFNMRVGISFWDESVSRESNFWTGRILWPYSDCGTIRYVVGRSYSGREPKYRNSGISKAMILYGIDNVKGETLVCEGIVSAIAASRSSGFPAVALLGKSISDFQLTMLKNRTNHVTICLDGTKDVTTSTRKKLNRKFLEYGFQVKEIILPDDKDPDDLGPEFSKFVLGAKRVKL